MTKIVIILNNSFYACSQIGSVLVSDYESYRKIHAKDILEK